MRESSRTPGGRSSAKSAGTSAASTTRAVRGSIRCQYAAGRQQSQGDSGRIVDSVIAIYPGSFDPITNGHLDLIQRGARMFDRLVVSILRNDSKQPLFSVEERMEMLREVVQVYPNVSVDSFEGLLVEHAAAQSATVLLRGIRAISDYEYELQMALMNRRLRPDIETVFLMASENQSFISSKLVKEVF